MGNQTLYAGDCILTYSGHYLNVFDPNPDYICIEDIAHGLSHMPRFAGQTAKFLSVAEHSFNVSMSLRQPFCLEGLLHDASETYLMDIPKPIKQHLPDYVKLEDNLMRVIAAKFGIPFPISPEVKIEDKRQLEFEHFHLRVKKDSAFTPMDSEIAKEIFLHRYGVLINKEVTNG